MKLHVIDEFSPLKSVAVCWGYSVPKFEDYKTDDPQELKWGWEKWDRELLLHQQDEFYKRLGKYGVELVFLEAKPGMLWQMFTRDTGFVIGDRLYYGKKRTLKVRNGEIEELLNRAKPEADKMTALPGKIEGGDVVVSDTSLVGISNRTNQEAFDELAKQENVKSLFIGDNVMHLDTRLTLLPNNYALVCLEAFSKEDREFLQGKYKVLPTTTKEAEDLGTNVFVVDPETIFVEEKAKRIQEVLKEAGFEVEVLAYSEPIVLDGSFRCTTLPLVRE